MNGKTLLARTMWNWSIIVFDAVLPWVYIPLSILYI